MPPVLMSNWDAANRLAQLLTYGIEVASEFPMFLGNFRKII